MAITSHLRPTGQSPTTASQTGLSLTTLTSSCPPTPRLHFYWPFLLNNPREPSQGVLGDALWSRGRSAGAPVVSIDRRRGDSPRGRPGDRRNIPAVHTDPAPYPLRPVLQLTTGQRSISWTRGPLNGQRSPPQLGLSMVIRALTARCDPPNVHPVFCYSDMGYILVMK